MLQEITLQKQYIHEMPKAINRSGRKQKLLKKIVFTLGITVFILFIFSNVYINYSPSLPRGVYLAKQVKTNNFVGKTVIVEHGLSDKPQKKLHLHGLPIHNFMKKVYGKAGDIVDYDKHNSVITINGQAIPNTEIKDKGSDGKLLQQMSYPYVIPPYRYWVGTERKCGYDSRYFGTVAQDAIKCEVIPLLVEGD